MAVGAAADEAALFVTAEPPVEVGAPVDAPARSELCEAVLAAASMRGFRFGTLATTCRNSAG